MVSEPKKTIEQIASEQGKYAVDAFVMVQECIGQASEHVHGPMSKDEQTIVHWIARREIDLDTLAQLYAAGQLPSDIECLVRQHGGPEALNRHVTGQQLCWAIRDIAIERWGRMAESVLRQWNVTKTEDIGNIVFALVENNWLRKQPTDSIEDFKDVFDFSTAFRQASISQAGQDSA